MCLSVTLPYMGPRSQAAASLTSTHEGRENGGGGAESPVEKVLLKYLYFCIFLATLESHQELFGDNDSWLKKEPDMDQQV